MAENPMNVHDVVIWDAAQIQAYADALRSRFFDRCKYIRNLEGYDGLYIYWDAYDIYHIGALNLWRVLHHMVFENQYYAQELRDITSIWINDYVQRILTDRDNCKKLLDWNPETEGILDVFKDGELEELDNLEQFYHGILRHTLLSEYMRLRQQHRSDSQFLVGKLPGKYSPAHIRSIVD
ncbi:hypothetical protein M434DRAFT_238014 [Hypoxylon sp. CO27-5]|nr:hypothetical protein M434DRAFT_238014 [Hypoxylon sp. CO27-5]